MSSIIQVTNISKQYRLGQVGTGTISHDLNRWWHRIRGKEDPFLKIGEENDRSKKGSSDYAWALRDINFEVQQGEVLGIIGRNGAGKSTLLKILSRTTAPTTGQIKIKGRVASLLEVGTGFHPELTGRENIYLNGAILGMTRHEIKSKFDEIVDFSGVERYIDTPVKRYSSGMYVRLAFAVAAHLEPEILIIDEVLAVGDAEFQKKCLGKMQDVSVNEGRTVLFVSHNMGAIRTICNKGLFLINGRIEYFMANLDILITNYLNDGGNKYNEEWQGIIGNEEVRIYNVCIRNEFGTKGLKNDEFLYVEIEFETFKSIDNLVVGMHLQNYRGDELAFSGLFDNLTEDSDFLSDYVIKKGTYKYQITIPPNTLAAGHYKIYPNIGIYNIKEIVYKHVMIEFEVINLTGIGRKFIAGSGLENIFRPNWKWTLINK